MINKLKALGQEYQRLTKEISQLVETVRETVSLPEGVLWRFEDRNKRNLEEIKLILGTMVFVETKGETNDY